MFTRIAILATLLLPCEGMAMKVNYVNMGITDDEIAAAITPPRPIAVSDLIRDMKRYEEIEELDLGENTITHKGAIKILESARNIKSLKKLSFYNNRIYDIQNANEYKKFERYLLDLLKNEAFKKLDLRLNGIANTSSMQKIISKAGRNASKIKW